ncbi:glycosyltransferase [Candidatus Omnitrophota bacterium]
MHPGRDNAGKEFPDMVRNGSIGVVILNYNKKNDLLRCLKAVCASDYPQVSVVVVDNNSNDGSGDVVQDAYPDIPLMRNLENVGVPMGRNVGWRYAKEHFDCEYICFLDNDSEVAPDYFSHIVRVFREHRQVGIVTGKAYMDHKRDKFCSVGISVNFYTSLVFDLGRAKKDKGQYNTPSYRDACGGFAMAIRREVLESLHAFDERYSPYGWEDVDICLRARVLGYHTFYTPDAVVIHKGTKVGREPVPEYERNKIRNYLLLLKRHTNFIQKVCCCIGVPLKSLYIIIEMLIIMHPKIIAAQCRGFIEGLRGR